MKWLVSDWFGLLFVVIVVYMLVRPSSPAAQLVDAIGGMLVSMVRRAADLGNA